MATTTATTMVTAKVTMIDRIKEYFKMRRLLSKMRKKLAELDGVLEDVRNERPKDYIILISRDNDRFIFRD